MLRLGRVDRVVDGALGHPAGSAAPVVSPAGPGKATSVFIAIRFQCVTSFACAAAGTASTTAVANTRLPGLLPIFRASPRSWTRPFTLAPARGTSNRIEYPAALNSSQLLLSVGLAIRAMRPGARFAPEVVPRPLGRAVERLLSEPRNRRAKKPLNDSSVSTRVPPFEARSATRALALIDRVRPRHLMRAAGQPARSSTIVPGPDFQRKSGARSDRPSNDIDFTSGFQSGHCSKPVRTPHTTLGGAAISTSRLLLTGASTLRS